jgi:AraC-like DNA-binding protein
VFGQHENNSTTQHSEFLSELHGIVLQKLSEDDFGVNVLAREVRLSRSQLHRKLKNLTGKSPSCFIREIRLRQASELLRENNNTISEIAYKVGFRSPSYFNKCFHDYFGHSPGVHKTYASQQNNLDTDFKSAVKAKPCHNIYDRLNRYYGLIILAIILLVLVLFILFRR